MKAKRHHLFIGTGLVAALSCGMAPLPATAATIPTQSDSVMMSAPDAVSDITLTQMATPKLKAGQSALTTIRVSNNTDTDTPRGATFELKAPAGTTFASNQGRIAFSDGYAHGVNGILSADKKTLTVDFAGGGTGYALNKRSHVDIQATLLSDADNTRSGRIADGTFTVVAGQAFPTGTNTTIAYEGDHAALTLTQMATPKLKAGQSALTTIRVSNNTDTDTPRGATFELKAPAGTTFASNQGRIAFSDGYAHGVNGILSADKKTLTVDFAGGGTGYALNKRSHVDIQATLLSDADNTRSGRIADGTFTVVTGQAFPTGTNTTIAYEGDHAALTLTQMATPKLKAGQSALTTIRVSNNTDTDTPRGATFELKAPAGTTFASNQGRIAFSDGYAHGVNGILSADKKTLTVDFAGGGTGYALNKRSHVDIQATLVSDADNTRSGRIADGTFTVVTGQAFPTGTNTAIAYDATYVAPKAIVLDAPAIGAVVTDSKRPVFSGTGEAGAAITVTGSSGRVVATTTVKADGTWSVPASFDLVNGNYYGTVSQGVDGSSARYEFVLDVKSTVAPVTLTSPAMNAEIEPGKPVFVGKGHPGATVTVQGAFGTPLGSAVVKTDGTWSIESTVSLVVGSYSGTAKQNVDGNVTSAAFAFKAVVSNPVTLTGPAIDAVLEAGKPLFTGTGKPGATVTVQGQYGTLLGSAVVKSDGSWSIESTVSLVAGYYSGTAKQDVDGKVTTAPFKFSMQ